MSSAPKRRLPTINGFNSPSSKIIKQRQRRQSASTPDKTEQPEVNDLFPIDSSDDSSSIITPNTCFADLEVFSVIGNDIVNKDIVERAHSPGIAEQSLGTCLF